MRTTVAPVSTISTASMTFTDAQTTGTTASQSGTAELASGVVVDQVHVVSHIILPLQTASPANQDVSLPKTTVTLKTTKRKPTKSLADERIAAAQAILATLDEREDEEAEMELESDLKNKKVETRKKPKTKAPSKTKPTTSAKATPAKSSAATSVKSPPTTATTDPVPPATTVSSIQPVVSPLQQNDAVESASPGQSSRRSSMRARATADGPVKSRGKTPVWALPRPQLDDLFVADSETSPRSTSTVISAVPVPQSAFSSLSSFDSATPFSLDKWIKKDLYTQHLFKNP